MADGWNVCGISFENSNSVCGAEIHHQIRRWLLVTCLTVLFGTLSHLGDLRTLRNWRSFRLVKYFCAKISMNFWIKLATQGYVFIKTPTHNAKSKGLAKSKHLCLLVTGCIFNHSVLLVSVNRMNITVGLMHVPQRTRASVSSRPQSQFVHTEEFVEGRTLPIHCSN